MVRCQVKIEQCITRAVITSSYLVPSVLGKFSNSREKALKSGHETFTTSRVKFQNKGFSGYLFPINVHSHLGQVVVFKVEWIGTVTCVKGLGIHETEYYALGYVTQENVLWIKCPGYLAVACLKAATCPRTTVDATLTFRTYRIASMITTLKLGPVADETRQNVFLALLSLNLKLTPFSNNHS